MIQLQKEYLDNEKNVSNIVETAKKILNKRKRMYNRYTRIGNRADISIPLEYYIVNIASGYFGGKAPEYRIKQETDVKKRTIIEKLFDKKTGKNADAEEFKQMIDYIRDYNDDSSFFYDLVKDYFATNACYGLLYETTDNEIVYSHVSSRQCVAIYDYSTPAQKIGLMRIWQELDNNGYECDMVEIITKDTKKYYKNSKSQPKEYKLLPEMQEEVKWDLLPAIAIENVDELAIFEPVITLIDAFEKIIQNNKNIFQYNDEAKLKITGFTPMNAPEIQDPNDPSKTITNPAYVKEIERIRKMEIFFTPDKSGDIGWVIKDINDTASENHKKTLLELILMTICIPNVTDVGFTNADNASALEKKFFPLEQSVIQADKLFKKELLAMWENIVARINLKKSTNFDFREILIELKRNMPSENKEMVDMALKLRQILSDETCMTMLPYDLDIESEKAKKQQEAEENIDKNFDNMVNLGKNKANVESKQKEFNQQEKEINNLEQKINKNQE